MSSVITPDFKAINEYIDAHKDESLERLKALCRIPSVSADLPNVLKCKEAVMAMLEELRPDVLMTIETPTNPAIYAEFRSARGNGPEVPSILFYGHYDVQPADPLDKWLSPPYEPEVRDGRLYGRGTADNKGQFLAHVEALRAWRAVEGELPITVKLILDGEEEDGSASMPWILEKYKDMLTADLIYVSDGGMYGITRPVINYGARGMMSIDITVKTGTMDNHSGNKGGAIENAGWRLVELLSAMADGEGNVLIPGFYDGLDEPNEAQMKMMEELEFEPEELRKLWCVRKLLHADDKMAHYRSLMFRPTMSINGLTGGYEGPSSKTVIPCSVTAKLDIRLVSGQRSDKVFKLVSDFVHAKDPDVEIKKYPVMEACVADPGAPAMEFVRQAVEEGFGVKPVNMPMMGGSLPLCVFKEILEKPVVGVPYATPDEQNHAPNENMSLWAFNKGIHATAALIGRFAEFKK